MRSLEKINRVDKINKLIRYIADIDRRINRGYSSFFMSDISLKGTPNYYGHFSFIGKKLFYFDKYTEEPIYPYPSSNDDINFSNGGTIWALVQEFREYIITGKEMGGTEGSSGLYSLYWGERWTIERKNSLLTKAKEIGYLSADSISFTDYIGKFIESGNDWTVKSFLEEYKKTENK